MHQEMCARRPGSTQTRWGSFIQRSVIGSYVSNGIYEIEPHGRRKAR